MTRSGESQHSKKQKNPINQRLIGVLHFWRSGVRYTSSIHAGCGAFSLLGYPLVQNAPPGPIVHCIDSTSSGLVEARKGHEQ